VSSWRVKHPQVILWTSGCTAVHTHMLRFKSEDHMAVPLRVLRVDDSIQASTGGVRLMSSGRRELASLRTHF
jgi:hypothetical protein